MNSKKGRAQAKKKSPIKRPTGYLDQRYESQPTKAYFLRTDRNSRRINEEIPLKTILSNVKIDQNLPAKTQEIMKNKWVDTRIAKNTEYGTNFHHPNQNLSLKETVRNNLDIYIGRNNEVIEVKHNQHQNCDQEISKVGYFDFTDPISDADPHYNRKYGNVKEKDRVYELYSISSAEASYNERSHFSNNKSKSSEKSLEPQTKIGPYGSKEDICKEPNYTCSMYDRDLMRVTKTGNQKSPSTIFDGDA
jgi:hypothetical protein